MVSGIANDYNTVTWQERCRSLLPRSFVVWYDCESQQVVKTAGLTNLGYSNLEFRSWKSLQELLHPDHQRIIEFVKRGLNRTMNKSDKSPFFGHLARELLPLWVKGIYLSLTCSIKKSTCGYWAGHATIEPCWDTNNNQISAFLIWVQITGEYNGQPFTGSFFPQKEDRNQRQAFNLNQVLGKMRWSILKGMRLSAKQYQQILLMISEQDRLKIAKTLGISIRTMEGHRNAILQIGRTYFPSRSFRTAQDFIEYLQLYDA